VHELVTVDMAAIGAGNRRMNITRRFA